MPGSASAEHTETYLRIAAAAIAATREQIKIWRRVGCPSASQHR